MTRSVRTLLASLMVGSACLSGCAVMTAGVSPGDERNFVRSLNDVNAERTVEARLKRAYDYDLDKVEVEVAEGVVLLSGTVPTAEDRIEAARIAWSAPEVVQLGNEILVGGNRGFVGNTKDGLLEKSVRTRLMADKYVKGRNYGIETHSGTVYLMGVARNAGELDRAARIAALTRGTREVVSYVRVHGDAVPVSETYDAPLPSQDQAERAAPHRMAPLGEPIPLAPRPEPYAQDGGAIPSLPPSNPNTAPYYVDPDTGEQIRVRNWLPETP